jgi:hypothetical protein
MENVQEADFSTGIEAEMLRPIRAGSNEFLGIAMPYGISSDDREIFAPGALNAAAFVPLYFEHRVIIGFASIWNTPQAVLAHGRIAGSTLYGQRALRLLQAGLSLELCLSTAPTDVEFTLFENKTYQVIKSFIPRELSLVLAGSLPGCGILQLGPVDYAESEWDRRFMAGLDHLFIDMARTAEICSLKAKEQAKGELLHRADCGQYVEGLRFEGRIH